MGYNKECDDVCAPVENPLYKVQCVFLIPSKRKEGSPFTFIFLKKSTLGLLESREEGTGEFCRIQRHQGSESSGLNHLNIQAQSVFLAL